jgi:hypothetical protein
MTEQMPRRVKDALGDAKKSLLDAIREIEDMPPTRRSANAQRSLLSIAERIETWQSRYCDG